MPWLRVFDYRSNLPMFRCISSRTVLEIVEPWWAAGRHVSEADLGIVELCQPQCRCCFGTLHRTWRRWNLRSAQAFEQNYSGPVPGDTEWRNR